ncbi:MAG: asparagine synthase (glutamine-hydrolyzing) [Desulfobulbaceae bacterium]|nr:asparagine synthase (glutamine-hydrolyzing) [Desulfobulbaceae bacterium]
MCGIAGFLGTNHESEGHDTVQRMLAAIAHRGPDGNGINLFPDAALGHVRLAIIDLAGGGQPMSTADQRLHISYNGELYNYRELRAELIGLGHVFHSQSDTEVVLAAYRQWGVAACNRFRGMYAFAIWDSSNRQGVLIRDRFGIKPLFYAEARERLLFASEAKAVRAGLGKCPELDLDALHLLLNFRYIPGDATLFTGIRQLPPGHLLTWHDNKVEVQRWSTPVEPAVDGDDRDERLRTLLKQAVRRQLVSDVPLGGYLSAGIDSSTLLALAMEEGGNADRFPTFTIKTGDSPLEASDAAATARFFGVANHQQEVPLEMERLLPRLIWHLEMPKVNGLQSAMVARLASRQVKVALSGLGGDEIFLGYNLHRLLALLAPCNTRIPSAGARLIGSAAQSLCARLGLNYEEWLRAGQALGRLPDFAGAYGILRNVWDSPTMRTRLYGPRLLDARPQDAFSCLHENWPKHPDPVTAAAEFELSNKMVNDLLLNEDRLSMAFGLETRVPFLDEDLATTVMGIDRRQRMPGGRLKGLMRQVVTPWLPTEILCRPKSGFQVPIHHFFNTHLRPLCAQYLNPDRLKADGLFNPVFVREILAARPHKRLRWHYFLLYLMLGTAIWIDIFEKEQEVPPWN